MSSTTEPQPAFRRSLPRPALLIVPAILLALAVLASAGVYRMREGAVAEAAEQRFAGALENATADVRARFNNYESLLYGARAPVFVPGASEPRVQWQSFVAATPLRERYPGVAALGYVEAVRRENLASFVSKVRAEGLPSYSVGPLEPGKETYYPVKYIEPFSENASWSGLDLGSDARLREAAERARDTGKPAATGSVRIVSNGQDRLGFVFLAPVYSPGASLSTPAERRQALRGWVLAPIAGQEMFVGLLGADAALFELKLHNDLESGFGTLMFDSLAGQSTNVASRFAERSRVLSLGGQQWTLRLRTLPAFDASFDFANARIWAVLVFLALVGMIAQGGLLVNTRDVARVAAKRMTAELRATADRLQRQNRFLDALRLTRLDLLSAGGSEDVLSDLVRRAAELAGTPHGYLFQLDPDGKTMTMTAGTGFFAQRTGDQIAPGQSVAGIAWQSGQPQLVRDYANWPGRVADPVFDQLESLAAAPLRQGERTVGVIGIAQQRGEDRDFGEEDMARLEQIGEMASLAIANADLFRQVQQANATLERRVEERTRALGESEDRYRGIIENIDDGVYELDLAGRTVLANAAARRLIDRGAEQQVIGLHYRQYVVPEDHAAVYRTYHEVFTTGESVAGIPFRVQTGRGEIRDVEASISLKRDGRGEPTGFRGTLRDISARTRAEAAQRQLSVYLTALNDTAVGLLAHSRLSDLLAEIISRAGSLVGSPHGYIYLLDSSGETMEMRVGTGIQREFVGNRIRPGEGVAGQVWETGKSLIVNDYRDWSGRLQSAGITALRAVAGVPLSSGGQIVGVIGLAHTEEGRRFGAPEVEILSRFASLASVALDNAQLLSQTQDALQLSRKRAQRLAAINRIGHEIARANNPEQIARTVFEQISHVMDNRNFYVAYYDDERNLITFPIYTIDGAFVRRETRRAGSGATEYLLRTRQPLLLNGNVSEEMRRLGMRPGGRPSRSWLGVPMVAGDKAIGVLCAQDYERAGALSPDDQELLTIVAAQTANALENSRLLQQARSRQREVETVNSISQSLASLLDRDTITDLVGDRLRAIFDTNVCYVALYDDRTKTISYPYFVEDGVRLAVPAMPFGSAQTSSVITTRQALLQRSAAQGPDGAEALPDAGGRILGTSRMAVPILVGNEPTGMIAVENYRYADAFADSELRMLGTIGANVGVALNNARLYAEQRKRARQEQVLREVSTRVRRAVDVDTVLRTAAQEVGTALGRRTRVTLTAERAEGEPEDDS